MSLINWRDPFNEVHFPLLVILENNHNAGRFFSFRLMRVIAETKVNNSNNLQILRFTIFYFLYKVENMSEMTSYDKAGNCLYLNAEERAAFLAVAKHKPARDRTLCETLHYTGCRPSELIEITPVRIDLSVDTVTRRRLEKRKDSSGYQKMIYRAVPVPLEYLGTLNTARGIREAQKSHKRMKNAPIYGRLRGKVSGNV